MESTLHSVHPTRTRQHMGGMFAALIGSVRNLVSTHPRPHHASCVSCHSAVQAYNVQHANIKVSLVSC